MNDVAWNMFFNTLFFMIVFPSGKFAVVTGGVLTDVVLCCVVSCFVLYLSSEVKRRDCYLEIIFLSVCRCVCLYIFIYLCSYVCMIDLICIPCLFLCSLIQVCVSQCLRKNPVYLFHPSSMQANQCASGLRARRDILGLALLLPLVSVSSCARS